MFPCNFPVQNNTYDLYNTCDYVSMYQLFALVSCGILNTDSVNLT